MDTQSKAAIIAIAVVIPLASFAVWNMDSSEVSYVTENKNQKIVAITSFYPIYEFTKNVGGNKVEVTQLIPFGIEPHDWEPTVKDLQSMHQADLIIINGIGFENWANDFASTNSNVIIVDTSKGITNDSLINQADPHIWLNPVMVQTQVANIADALMEIDPANREYYNTNANSYILRLDQLDQKIKNELSQCEKKDFVAFHSAFSYFAEQYGLTQHTILESNEPHDEPTSKNLENIINLAKSLDIDVIFTEEAVDTRTSQVIADEIGGTVLVLSPLEIGDQNTDYIAKMEQNLANLKEGLCN
ncbi:MAG: metal ABC transporter substrate-binding protein [Nitrosopumilaceae archaeon]